MFIKQAGWKTINGEKRWIENDEFLVCEWREINKHIYYFDEFGNMCTGWAGIEGSWYYFSKSDKVNAINGKKYPEGALVKNSFMMEEECDGAVNGEIKYYLGENGEMSFGLKEIDGDLYYFSQAKTESTSGNYYLEGMMYVDEWYTDLLNNKTYYFGKDGKQVKGKSISIKRNKVSFDEKGEAVNLKAKHGSSPWLFFENEYYYKTDTGVLMNQWKEIDGKKYYFKENGSCPFGWTTIEGSIYYFEKPKATDPPHLIMNKFITKNNLTRYVDGEGKMAKGKTKIGPATYFFAESAFHCSYSGLIYQEGQIYKSEWYKDQETNNMYYFDDKGVMVKGKTITLFNVDYDFDENGINTKYMLKNKRFRED